MSCSSVEIVSGCFHWHRVVGIWCLFGKSDQSNRKNLQQQWRRSLEIAQFRHKTMSQVAINWCICKGTIPIPGAKNFEQAQQNIGALGWQLEEGEVAELDQAAAKVDKTMVQNIFQSK